MQADNDRALQHIQLSLSVTRHLVPRKKAYQANANGNDAFTHIVQAHL